VELGKCAAVITLGDPERFGLNSGNGSNPPQSAIQNLSTGQPDAIEKLQAVGGRRAIPLCISVFTLSNERATVPFGLSLSPLLPQPSEPPQVDCAAVQGRNP